MASAYEKIQQAKKEYEAAKKKGNVNAMAAAHLKADQARNYNTVTKADDKGRLYQAPEIIGGTLKPEPVKKLPPATTAARVRTGTLPNYTPPKETVGLTLPMGKTIQVPVRDKGILGEAFDKNENYIDKLKKGNLGGSAANFLGTGLTAAQTLYLNTANTVDSVAQGKGLPKYQPQMDFSEYDKAVAERRGAKPTIEQVKDINPALGGAYQFLGEVGTDPLELTPMGYLNDIKMAKGFKPNTASYMAALQSGKLNPIGVTATLPRATTTAPQPRVLPKAVAAKNAPVNSAIQESDTATSKFFRLDNGIADVSGHIPKDGSTPFIDQIYYSSKLSDDTTDVSNIPKQFVGKGNINKAVTNAIDYIGKNGKAEFQIKIMNGQSKKVMDRLVSEGKIKQLTDYKFEGDDVTYAINNPQTIPRATESTVQPILPRKGTEIPKEQPFAKNGDLQQPKLKDLGADTNKFDAGQKVSKVKSNTFQNSEVFTAAEKEMLNNKDYTYDVVSEKQSLAEAKQRLESNFDAEVNDLPNKANFDGTDMDTSMGILESYLKDARETGDYSKVDKWAKTIQEKGTQGGQLIQSFSKYSRTPEGALVKAKQTIAKVERDIEKANPNLINKVEQETKQVTNAIKKAEQETIESLGDVVEKAVRSRKSPVRKISEAPFAGNPIRTVEEAVASLTDKNMGELIGEYTESSAKKLANQSDVLQKKNPRQIAPLQEAFDDLTKELYKIAQETLPAVKTAKQEIKATDILKTVIENKQNYQEVWLNAKYLLQRKYANNPEAMKLFDDFFNKDVVPNFSKKTLNTAIKQTAKDFSADLNKIFKASQNDKAKLAKDIQDYILYKVGVKGDDAKALADEILNQYNAILKAKTESALKQMFPEAYGRGLRKAGQKSTYEKVVELINMGAYDNEAIKNIIKAKNNLPVLENSEIKAIIENMELSVKSTDSYMKKMYASRAEQIISNKMPREFRQKFRALQRLSMIFNPKTLLTRNPLGNVVLGGVENVKDIPGAGIDAATTAIRNKFRTAKGLEPVSRTTAFAPIQKLQAQGEGFKQGLNEWRKDIKYNVDTSPSRGQMELPQGKVFNDGVVGDKLNFADEIERYALQLGDRPFYQAAYNSRIKELELLGKTGEEAQKEARLFALDRVFQNDSELATRAMAIRKSMGLPGDLLMPFVQTPANIMDKLLDYSPVGMAKAISQMGTVGKGTFDQKLFVDRLARSFTGVGIGMVAFAMASNGILTGKMDKSEDVRNAQYKAGEQGYSIKLGGTYYSYDWMQPIGGILAAVTDAHNAGAEKDDILEAMATGTGALIDSVFNMSFLSGLLDAFSGYSPAAGLGSALLGSTSQLTPSAGANFAKTIDPYMRETYDPNRFKQQANKLVARTPLLSMTLPKKLDVSGQPIMQSQGRNAFARLAENFVLPYKRSDVQRDPVNDELLRLYDSTGNTGQLLNAAVKNFTISGETYIMSQNDYTRWQKTTGQYAYREMRSLINTSAYKTMSDTDKTKALAKINDNATQKAKYEYFDNKGLPVTLALDKTYQEKYEPIKHVVSDKQFYTAVESVKGKSRDIEKAYAISLKLPNVDARIYDTFGISQEAVEKANLLKQNGITAEQYDEAIVKSNTNGNANVSKAEATEYLDSMGYPKQKKYAMLKALVPNLKDKNNPYY